MAGRTVRLTRNCLCCGEPIHIYNGYYIDKRPILYCSLSCKNNKYGLNYSYFSGTLTPDKLITLGQIVATGFVQNYHTIIVRSDQSTIDDIQSKLGSRYPIEKSDNGKLRLKLSSTQMVNDLIEMGLVHNPIYQDYIPYDILDGLIRTDCHKMIDGVHTFRTPSSKLALELARLVSGKIITETYKDVFKGVLGCDWIVIWSD